MSRLLKNIFANLFWLFPLIASATLFAQAPPGYTRKSIAHTTVILTMENIRLNKTEEKLFLDAINTGIKIPRFDYNPLPEKIQSSFRKALSRDKSITEAELDSVINKTLVPEIIKMRS